MLLSSVFCLTTVFLSVLLQTSASEFNFRAQLADANILEKLGRHFDHKHIQTMDLEQCKVYNVHVQRWVNSLTRYPAGIACKCDWVMTPNAFYGTTIQPTYIFIATRALHIFGGIIDKLQQPFVLISAINDETIPYNHDHNIGLPTGFTGRQDGLWEKIVNHPKLLHWFLENHSAVNHTKVSTLPIMFVSKPSESIEPDIVYDLMLKIADAAPKWHNRSTLILSSDRVRDGIGNWHDRAVVQKLCIPHPLCSLSYTVHDGTIAVTAAVRTAHESDVQLFMKHVSNAKFLIMAHGGGLDPCPKLVHSIVLGTIPIIQSNALDDAYSQLPVVIIPSLEQFLHPDNVTLAGELLSQWSAQYAPYYELGSELRNQTLHKLSEEYWWNLVTSYGPK